MVTDGQTWQKLIVALRNFVDGNITPLGTLLSNVGRYVYTANRARSC